MRSTTHPIFLLLCVLCVLCVLCGESFSAQRPNILWLSAEDISPHFGCYGDPHAITPNIDALAAQGTRYTNAFTTAGVCAPCRSGIITGMYQTSIGTHHMRCNATLPDFIKPFPLYLKEAGYYCTNASKTDYQFSKPSKSEIWDVCGGKGHWRNRPDKDQPFFAVFNYTGCHESGIASESKYKQVTVDLKESQRQDPKKLTLPPYYPDTPIVREDWKRNYELITAMDAWAGELLSQLEEDGLAENTIVLFWSDHGVGLPRAKRWLYDSGTRIPLVIRIPEKYRTGGQGQPGSVTDELVSSIDFGPTALHLAGLPVPAHVQGRAFLGANLTPERDYVYGARDRMDERYDIIRMVRDKRYRYIRNYEPLKTFYQYMNTPEKGAIMKEIRRIAAAGQSLPPGTARFLEPRKDLEELYDLKTDPHEMHNLAADPAHADRLAKMRKAHLQWVQDTKDLGLIPESEIAIREKAAGSRYNILRAADGDAINARLGNIAAKASEGPSAIPLLAKALADEDAAVRYWAATGLGNVANGYDLPKKTLPLLREALTDASPAVRIAAARALCHTGHPDEGLPILVSEMESEHQWGRLAAAIVLDEIDEMARPALPALEKGLEKQPNKYITRVANRARNELLGTENSVP